MPGRTHENIIYLFANEGVLVSCVAGRHSVFVLQLQILGTGLATAHCSQLLRVCRALACPGKVKKTLLHQKTTSVPWQVKHISICFSCTPLNGKSTCQIWNKYKLVHLLKWNPFERPYWWEATPSGKVTFLGQNRWSHRGSNVYVYCKFKWRGRIHISIVLQAAPFHQYHFNTQNIKMYYLVIE